MTYDGEEIQDPQKNPEAPFEVRDLRNKEKFVMDDRFLNGYAKEVGIYGTAVYVSLCRHADREQTCWPSIDGMAEELSISRHSVLNGLRNLKECRIIGTIHRKGTDILKGMHSRYILFDKRYWRHRKTDSKVHNTDFGKGISKVHDVHFGKEGLQSAPRALPSKETHKDFKETPLSAANAAAWSWMDFLEKMKKDPKRPIQIIALYYQHQQTKYDSAAQAATSISRHIRAAQKLEPFTDEEIRNTMAYIDTQRRADGFLDFWTLDTVLKYIDEGRNHRKPGKIIVDHRPMRSDQ